jgi:hypothetical protein
MVLSSCLSGNLGTNQDSLWYYLGFHIKLIGSSNIKSASTPTHDFILYLVEIAPETLRSPHRELVLMVPVGFAPICGPSR